MTIMLPPAATKTIVPNTKVQRNCCQSGSMKTFSRGISVVVAYEPLMSIVMDVVSISVESLILTDIGDCLLSENSSITKLSITDRSSTESQIISYLSQLFCSFRNQFYPKTSSQNNINFNVFRRFVRRLIAQYIGS